MRKSRNHGDGPKIVTKGTCKWLFFPESEKRYLGTKLAKIRLIYPENFFVNNGALSVVYSAICLKNNNKKSPSTCFCSVTCKSDLRHLMCLMCYSFSYPIRHWWLPTVLTYIVDYYLWLAIQQQVMTADSSTQYIQVAASLISCI